MVMPRDQNAGQSHNIKIDSSSFERVEQFRNLGTILTLKKIYIHFQEEIKSRKKKGNAYSSSEQNLLSSSLLSIYIRTQTYRKINLPVV